MRRTTECELQRGGICAIIATLLLSASVTLAAGNNPKPGSSAFDLDGRAVDPFAATNAAATVLVFVACECPIANRYAPEIRRMHEKFSPRGARFWMVYADPDATAEEIRKHVREFSLPGEALRDPRHALARKSKAKITPEGAVFDARGRLAYHGRIDDRVVDFGKERSAPTQRDLHDAIEAVLAGRKPRKASTAAVGCRIPELR